MLLLHLVLNNIGISACGLIIAGATIKAANIALDRALKHLESRENK